MTRDQAQLVRLLLMSAAWAIGRILTVGIPIELGDIVVPAALAAGVYVITEDLGRPRSDRGEGKYWRGRRIDDDRPGPRRLN
ncbi:MAG TPA: hypothetical protein VGK15_08070 [Candidatus Limnocylindria bacterium]|jgi:hypothetical protein